MFETKKAYDQILKLMRKHEELCVYDISEFERVAETHLFGLKLKEEYGLDIEAKQIKGLNYVIFGDKEIALYGEKYNRTISFPVDGRQPEDEYLLRIGFSTGAYMFGYGDIFNKDYPVEFFQKFWLELKSYNPDYTDEANKTLYWKLENAKDIFNNYDNILRKWHKLNEEDIKQRKIAKMKADIERLENTNP